MSSEQHPFFFYGTLRRGQENYTLLRWRTIHEQPARAPSMVLYSLKQYPIMTFGDGFVYGDLDFLHPRVYRELMAELDFLEGYDETNPLASMLRRVLIPVELETGKQLLAWAYMCRPQDVYNYGLHETIEHGDWAFYKKRLLLERRFERYDSSMLGQPAGERWCYQNNEQDLPMPQSSIFQWREGLGWLVLAGKGNFEDFNTSEILSQALTRTVAEGPLVYIWAAGDIDEADKELERLADMGSRTGYLVDIVEEDNTTLREQFEDAGVIVIADGPNIDRLRGALEGPVMRAIQKAYEQGATLIGIGSGAAVLGQWMLDSDKEIRPSFAWLKHAIVTIDIDDTPAMDKIHHFLRDYPNAYSLGLNSGAATAFSPDGALEVWGNQQITVSLGKNLAQGE